MQVGECDGQRLELVYGDAHDPSVSAHLYFHFQKAAEEARVFAHYSILAPVVGSTGSKKALVLPRKAHLSEITAFQYIYIYICVCPFVLSCNVLHLYIELYIYRCKRCFI